MGSQNRFGGSKRPSSNPGSTTVAVWTWGKSLHHLSDLQSPLCRARIPASPRQGCWEDYKRYTSETLSFLPDTETALRKGQQPAFLPGIYISPSFTSHSLNSPCPRVTEQSGERNNRSQRIQTSGLGQHAPLAL